MRCRGGGGAATNDAADAGTEEGRNGRDGIEVDPEAAAGSGRVAPPRTRSDIVGSRRRNFALICCRFSRSFPSSDGSVADDSIADASGNHSQAGLGEDPLSPFPRSGQGPRAPFLDDEATGDGPDLFRMAQPIAGRRPEAPGANDERGGRGEDAGRRGGSRGETHQRRSVVEASSKRWKWAFVGFGAFSEPARATHKNPARWCTQLGPLYALTRGFSAGSDVGEEIRA
ncbi:hypothetical protein ACHAWF_007120 [Thalassiosira exigua]